MHISLLAVFLILCACSSGKSWRVAETHRVSGRTGISGTVTGRTGGGAAGAYVFVYRSAASGLRGPADFESQVDDDGGYFLDLPPGTYYLVARRRASGSDNGPPRPGDVWGVYAKNPVMIEAGFTTLADLRLAGGGRPMLARRGESSEKNASFSGKVRDVSGNPVVGIHLLAYRDADFKGSPAFVSSPTDGEGGFSLAVEGPGDYCLVARSQTRGQPVEGELYGRLENRRNGCVGIKVGAVVDVGEIVVIPMD